jgi:dolichyl-phosphate-mannose--protein O-mannosyl transferase
MQTVKTFFKYWKISLFIILVFALLVNIVIQKAIMFETITGIFLSVIVYMAIKYLFLYFNKLRKNIFINIFVVALIVRIIMIPIINIVFVNTTDIPFKEYKDDYVYHQVANDLCTEWENGNWTTNIGNNLTKGNYSGYPIFSAFMMYLFGKSYLVMRFINAIIGAIIAVVLVKIAQRLYFRRENYILVAALVTLFPVSIFYSITNYKENLLLLLILLSLFSFIKIMNRGQIITNIFVIVCSLAFMTMMRTAIPVLIIFSFLLYITLISQSNKIRMYILSIIVILVFSQLWSFLSEYQNVSNANEYFFSRFDNASTVGIKSLISSSSIAGYFTIPLFALGALFVPNSMVVDLYQGSKTTIMGDFVFYFNVMYFTVMSISFFIVIMLVTSFKKKRVREIYLIIILLILYKLILATSLNLLSIRHNYPSIILQILLIPASVTALQRLKRKKLLYIPIIIQVFAFFAYNYVRFSIRL